MAKFINVPLQDKLINQESAGATVTDKLTLASTTGLSVGDYVHDETGGDYATITAIDSATVVSLSADIAVLNDVVSIYSAAVSTNSRLISADNALLVAQTAAVANDVGSTALTYATNGADVLTITHAGTAADDVSVANALDQALKDAHSSAWYKTVDLKMPSGLGVFAIAIA